MGRLVFLLLLAPGCYHEVWDDGLAGGDDSTSSSTGSASTTWVGTVTTVAPDAHDAGSGSAGGGGTQGAVEGVPCNGNGTCDPEESGVSCSDCAVCGNLLVEAGEECDGGDGCEADCRWTPAVACSGPPPTADTLAELVPVCLQALDYASALACLLEAPEATGCDLKLWEQFLAVFQLCDGSPPVCWQAWVTWPQYQSLWLCEGC